MEHADEWYAAKHASGSDRFFGELRTARDVLRSFPSAGRMRPEIGTGVRSYPVHPFIVFYAVDEVERIVTLVRVLRGHRDLDTVDLEEREDE